jgi:uroporphyrinogen decarboxylase
MANSRERVNTAIDHQEPDRVPADFVATPEVWDKLIAYYGLEQNDTGLAKFLDHRREAVLAHLGIDCRVLSYDMFCAPPASTLRKGARVDWWTSLDRSTPNRMWRQLDPDGSNFDIWGVHRHKVSNEFGAYEELASCPLQGAETLSDLRSFPWPEPDWWDFSPLPEIVRLLDTLEPYHLRFRIGSVFEIAWQLRGMQQFLVDLVSNPEMPRYIMARLTDIHVENTRRVLKLLGDRLDMVYLYDDVGTQNSLMISPRTWRAELKPHYATLAQLAHSRGVKVMYHCDGAIVRLIPELIEVGIDVLNPIQPGVPGMDRRHLKAEFGDRLAFHGGIDIVKILPHGTPEEVMTAVRECVDVLGEKGGYVLCSAHHIQADTPIANIVALYDVSLRYRRRGHDAR